MDEDDNGEFRLERVKQCGSVKQKNTDDVFLGIFQDVVEDNVADICSGLGIFSIWLTVALICICNTLFQIVW